MNAYLFFLTLFTTFLFFFKKKLIILLPTNFPHIPLTSLHTVQQKPKNLWTLIFLLHFCCYFEAFFKRKLPSKMAGGMQELKYFWSNILHISLFQTFFTKYYQGRWRENCSCWKYSHPNHFLDRDPPFFTSAKIIVSIIKTFNNMYT